MLVMLTITWFNRMLNGTTSGKWTTIFLLTVSLAPPVLQLDDLILVTIMNKESGFIPFDNSTTHSLESFGQVFHGHHNILPA